MPVASLLSRAAVVFTAASLPLALAFQPGADYGQYKTTNLYNCTGHIPTSNVTVRNAADTLPQIDPSSGNGWERWDLFLHGTYPIVMRWSQGDPSVPSSVPSLGKFEMLILDINNETVHASVADKLTYKNDENFKQIAVGNNTLTWDASAEWFNVSTSAGGYSITLDSFSSMLDTFHPNVEFYNGLLDSAGGPGWYGSVPVPRGHVTGYIQTPNSTETALDGLSSLKHMFSRRPLPEYINKYSAATAWGYSKTFYDTHIFYQTEETNGTVHDAAYLGRALPVPGQSGVFSTASAIYAITDDTALYQLSVNPSNQTINAALPGCPNTNNISYVFNMSTATLLGSFTDLGGGKTTYHAVNGTTTAPFDGSSVDGSLSGIFEEYQAPSKGGDDDDGDDDN
ncbi:hypothetical protein F5I97DRAFT_1830617 [Phlebopus sp. FC_14]|nr:hypothetical protein F5I97DRAFT_1830617 [Phlebopus sp. FC_14]